MPHHKFIELLSVIGPLVPKQDTPMRMSTPPGERLALTLRYLATGESFQSLSFQFRIGRTTIGEIVMQVCTAMLNTLKETYLKTPSSEEKWREIAELFLSRWNIPNNIGAIDGKHIVIQKPAFSGSHYHDYKGNESIIALVVSGPDYECLYADIGTNGRNPDGHA
ncbi:Protein ANTAGONIST OF LIKE HETEROCHROMATIN PROTEIN 1 [Acropora cervicornis]|uniref:Protein ANTAGONIST OF LIKE HETEROCHROMATIN PROTEIN 1 n=1 Tax=Acropora cervicornis TaxID=6130 RepID=A0AAD9Q6A2_ACRCE|nr:Protein ANTAGONIST OF LIKE HETEROCHROMATIN PROTEIN 1 [Acropora cervicornis]